MRQARAGGRTWESTNSAGAYTTTVREGAYTCGDREGVGTDRTVGVHWGRGWAGQGTEERRE